MYTINSLLGLGNWSLTQATLLREYYHQGLVNPYQLTHDSYNTIVKTVEQRQKNKWLNLGDNKIINVLKCSYNNVDFVVSAYKHSYSMLYDHITEGIWKHCKFGTEFIISVQKHSGIWTEISSDSLIKELISQEHDLYTVLINIAFSVGQRIIIYNKTTKWDKFRTKLSLYLSLVK